MSGGMTLANQTVVTEFILLGFSNLLQLQLLIFLVLLVMYILSLMGNILIMFITIMDPALSSPMYFFLRNLSFLDVCFTTVVVPKLLANLLSRNKSISFSGCKVQMFFFFFFGTVECFLLAAMAYDRYVAIHNPLRYTIVMNRRMCTQIILASWMSGIPVGTIQTSWLFSFPFCEPNEVHHFFCDGPPVLELVCADTYLFEMYSLTATIIIILSPFVLILASYTCIIYTVMKMKSAEGRRKAFSTCSSHLIAVTLMYGTGSLTYIRPKSSYSPDTKRFLSLSYTVITPMLNPLIYSLRNNEVKGTLRRILDRKISFW